MTLSHAQAVSLYGWSYVWPSPPQEPNDRRSWWRRLLDRLRRR